MDWGALNEFEQLIFQALWALYLDTEIAERQNFPQNSSLLNEAARAYRDARADGSFRRWMDMDPLLLSRLRDGGYGFPTGGRGFSASGHDLAFAAEQAAEGIISGLDSGTRFGIAAGYTYMGEAQFFIRWVDVLIW